MRRGRVLVVRALFFRVRAAGLCWRGRRRLIRMWGNGRRGVKRDKV